MLFTSSTAPAGLKRKLSIVSTIKGKSPKTKIENFFKTYASSELLFEYNHVYRTPIIKTDENTAYQAECFYEDAGPMGEYAIGKIIHIDKLREANEEAKKFVEGQRKVQRITGKTDFEGKYSAIVKYETHYGFVGSDEFKLWNPRYIETFYTDRNGITDALERSYIMGTDNYKISEEPFISYNPETREESNITKLLESITWQK